MRKPKPMVICFLLLLAAWSSTNAGRAAAQPVAETREETQEAPALEALVAEAIEKSAELAALEERIRASEALVAPAGALPDPMASVALSNVPVGDLSLSLTPMSGVQLGVKQKVPFSSKRRLRRAIARDEAVVLRYRYHDRRNDIVRQVKRAYFELQYLDEAIRITGQTKALAEDFLATAEARYATGAGIQQDVFRAQVRLSRMIDALIALRQRRAAAAARLNGLLYRPQSSVVRTLPAPRLAPASLEGEALRARMEAANPRIAGTQERIKQAKSRRALARKGLIPDFTFGVGYRVRGNAVMDPVRGKDFWSASVAVNLPFVFRGEKVDKEVEASGAQVKAAAQDLDALANDLSFRLEDLVTRVRRDEDQLALVETGLLPQAEGALASSRAAYETGKVPFLTLLDNQMNLYNLQLQEAGLAADHEKALADLAYVVGAPLPQAETPQEVTSSE